MSTEWRLVCQHTSRSYHGYIDVTDRFYVLQHRNPGPPASAWETVPIVDFNDLPREEQQQIGDALLLAKPTPTPGVPE